MTQEVLVIAKFLLWLRRRGVKKIVISATLDREPDQVYDSDERMLDLAVIWFASKDRAV
jgi:hypothetical protein